MNISAPFVARPVATILLTIGIALAGIFAYFRLPVSPLPQVDFPTIQVQAQLPGASPETMAASVATPLERRFGRIAGGETTGLILPPPAAPLSAPAGRSTAAASPARSPARTRRRSTTRTCACCPASCRSGEKSCPAASPRCRPRSSGSWRRRSSAPASWRCCPTSSSERERAVQWPPLNWYCSSGSRSWGRWATG